MAGVGFNPDQHGGRSRLRGLKSCREFKAVGGNHPIIMVARRYKRRRIIHVWLKIVEGGISVESFNFFGFFRGPVTGGPAPAARELIDPQHAHDAHGWKSGRKKTGPVSHAGADEHPAVTATG